MIAPRFLLIGSAVLYLVSPALLVILPGENIDSSFDSINQREARNASAFAQMLGEFRTSLSDMLFVKTERYLDSGVAYAPHIDVREMESSGIATGQKLDSTLGNKEMASAAQIPPGKVAEESNKQENHTHHDHDHETDGNVKTIIRTANDDFRGFIGKLERQVKPWRDPSKPHQHTAGTELLPWYRIATLSDPHNVRNYMIGAWWLKTLNTPEQRKEAIKFLDEGIAENPKAYELYLMKGYVLRQMDQLSQARESFSRSVKFALDRRPDGPFKETATWDTTDEEQLGAAMTMEINLTRDLVSTDSAIMLTNKYQKKLPEEGSLKRIHQELVP